MQPDTVAGWLAHLERLHPKTIELGLSRVIRVRDALGLKPDFPVITVGGTNGKGSVCAMLESILSNAGYRVGLYTSPHLLAYNERVRIARQNIDDEALCRSFAAVEKGRGDVALTYFEFGTLAALWHFAQAGVDVAILEVGLGGRLDAVNAFDADCAVVTSVDLDHQDYLGDTREKIGFEKAGIFRGGKPAICADPDPPASLLGHAAGIGAMLLRIGQDFSFRRHLHQWDYRNRDVRYASLPHPALRGVYQLNNAAAALAVLDQMKGRLPVTRTDIRLGLLQVELPGRFQVLPGRPLVILDVAHNPHGAKGLAASLQAMPPTGRTTAVFAMLADKDIAGVIEALRDQVDRWLVAGLPMPRGATAELLMEKLTAAGLGGRGEVCVNVEDAYGRACREAGEDDKILVFGSFHTVAEVLKLQAARKHGKH